MTDPAERHAAIAQRFTEITDGVRDWDAPTAVPEWAARDVVEHLLIWLPRVLSGWAGIELRSDETELTRRWRSHSTQVQQLLDEPATAGQVIADGPFAGGTLAEILDRIYLPDVFMHAWDLARSSDQDPGLDPDYAQHLLAGMKPIEGVLRSSGQYGPAHDTTSTDPVDQLMAFVGRDPQWRPN